LIAFSQALHLRKASHLNPKYAVLRPEDIDYSDSVIWKESEKQASQQAQQVQA